ncbi:tetratricopeptide repeat protein [Streptomyces montanus]|uniref:Tetratricopeptide repeat protein n=1 Tax=Streptomyces montanus TaxID=2580423 RepID=A0A5R9FQA1_9ACTN|nr:tetratricopeptide repeat protein [Streptomyces montanus]TLS46092.1 tetratricopeptide repeat protein [Streptomyces montanus]
MTTNEIGGDAHLTGLIVQARDVNGGTHHHPPAQKLPPPRQLPLVPAHFTDREEEADALDAARLDGAALAVISGLAGVGKTALAARWLTGRTAENEAQLHAELGGHAGPAAPEAVLQQWLRAFGIHQPPAGQRELTGLWRSVTADRPVAVLLDNAGHADQVRPLLPAGTASMTVVTSRRSLWELAVDGAALLSLGPLTPRAAVALLARFTGTRWMAAEPEPAARLVHGCAHLPLPLVLAGARLKSRPARSLAAAADALVHPLREDPARMAITTGLTETYTGLEATAQYVYRSLSLLPVDAVDPDMVAAVCRLEWAEADWLLEVLADEQLLEPCASAPGSAARYRMGTAVREHARALAEQHDASEERDGVVGRLCVWMLAIATHAQERLTPAQATLRSTLPSSPDAPAVFTDDAEAMAWLEAHETSLLAVLQAAVAAGADETAWQLVDAFWPLFLRRHPYTLWAKAHEIGLAAARRAGNPAAVRQMLLSGAIGLSSAGRLTDATDWYTQALDAARADGDPRDEGQALLGLGSCHHNVGRPEQALPLLARAITLWEERNYPRGVALATIVLGEIALADEPGRALDLFVRARTMLLEADDPYDATRALVLQGHARVLVGDSDAGVRDLEEALAVLTDAGSTRWRARGLELLGQAHLDRGERDAARACFQQAADLYVSIRPADAERVRALAGGL